VIREEVAGHAAVLVSNAEVAAQEVDEEPHDLGSELLSCATFRVLLPSAQ